MVRVISIPSLTGSSSLLPILRLVTSATAVAGSVHAVSGASISLVNPAGGKVRATNGISNPFRIHFTYTEGSKVSAPTIYESVNLPPGFNQPSKSGAIWRITGTPTQTGVFPNVRVTGYEKADKSGDHKATVTLMITVVDAVPQILQQPDGFTAVAGTPAKLEVAASGSNLTYQWLKDDLELPNETNPVLTFTALRTGDAGSYQVRVKNSEGLLMSDPALVAVLPGVLPPTFTLTPESITVHEGESFVLTSAASAESPLSFAWRKDDQLLPEAAGQDLAFAAATPTDHGSYTVSVTNAGGTITSPPASVTVVAPLMLGTPLWNSGGLILPFNGITGRTYVLESTTDLVAPVWDAAGELMVGESSLFAVPDPGSPAHWFRVHAR